MIAVLPSAQPFSREISAEKPATFSRAEKALGQYGNAILRLAYSYLHNMSDAEDILQDTLLKYMQSAPVFENAQHEKAWLLCVASNLCKNKLSYNKIRETDELLETLTAEEREDLSSAESAKQTDSAQKIRHFSSYLQKRLALAACAAELSKKAGFPVQDIESLPFIPTSTTYSWCWDIFAEITYESSSNTAWYRKTTGTEDISGDYTDYDQIMTETINGSTVTLKGNDDSIFLAVWQKDGYSSSLNFSDGISLDSIARPKNNAKKAVLQSANCKEQI